MPTTIPITAIKQEIERIYRKERQTPDETARQDIEHALQSALRYQRLARSLTGEGYSLREVIQSPFIPHPMAMDIRSTGNFKIDLPVEQVPSLMDFLKEYGMQDVSIIHGVYPSQNTIRNDVYGNWQSYDRLMSQQQQDTFNLLTIHGSLSEEGVFITAGEGYTPHLTVLDRFIIWACYTLGSNTSNKVLLFKDYGKDKLLNTPQEGMIPLSEFDLRI